MESEEVDTKSIKLKCKACNRGFSNKKLYEKHRKTKEHKDKEQLVNLPKILESIEVGYLQAEKH